MFAWLFILFLFVCLIVAAIWYDSLAPKIIGNIKSGKLNIWRFSAGLFFVFVSLIILTEKPKPIDSMGRPIHTHLWFAISLICALMLVWSAFRNNYSKNNSESISDKLDKICISCGTIFKTEDVANSCCAKCGGVVEAIKGAMDRHPELLDRIKKNS
ncbi:MAG: hypothetical protein PVJ19_00810 [Desulfobacteraceae bacterium]|jgi:hypothetical protein